MSGESVQSSAAHTGTEDGELAVTNDPFALFAMWMNEAETAEPNDPNAMALATVDREGLPNVRMVLLKGIDAGGFVFYTNEESQKGEELAATEKAAVVFHWKSLRRQVRVRGPVTIVNEAESDSYFASRPRLSQIGAWASHQSRPLAGRFELEASVAKMTTKFAIGAIPRPPHWHGYRIVPTYVEFWRDRPFRLHDRLVFRRANSLTPWAITKLYP